MKKTLASLAEIKTEGSIDSRFLESLIGYNARRSALKIIDRFHSDMKAFGLSTVEFSILSLIFHNPGITSKQLCNQLLIFPPNMVVMQKSFLNKGLIVRTPHPTDGRAFGLELTPSGVTLIKKAQAKATASDALATASISTQERKTLVRLLKKIYQSN
jgi:hypothetical protein